MLKNYLNIAIRNLARHKAYTFINIAGLAIGMASCALILLYVQYEMSYDDFFSRGNRIYKVLWETQLQAGKSTTGRQYKGQTGGALAQTLMNDFAEVEKAIRLTGRWNVPTRPAGQQTPKASSVWAFVDPDFFTLFDFPFVSGDPNTALQTPNSVVISKRFAQQLFGTEDPIGKTIRGNVYGDFDVVVTGIFKSAANSNFKYYDLIAEATPLVKSHPRVGDRWNTWQPITHTYVLLREGVNPQTVEAKLPDFTERYRGRDVRANNAYRLQPVQRLHLYRDVDYPGTWPQAATGNIEQIYLFVSIAFFILLIACVNFMNLSTARSSNRAKEVGMRKVSGAYRFQIVYQFLGEAILLSFLAFFVALGLTELALPPFSAYVERDLTLYHSAWYLAPLTIVIIGFLAGCYPALFLSAFQPVDVLKGQFKTGLKGGLIRKGLVVFQFAMSILFIIGTLVVYRQLSYIQNKDLGYDQNLIISTGLIYNQQYRGQHANLKHVETIKQALLTHPNILKVTAGSPRSGRNVDKFSTEDGREYSFYRANVDTDFLDTFAIPLIAGRNLRPEDDDRDNYFSKNFLINEAAAKMLGWKDPVGKQLFGKTKPITVVGVVSDFHHKSLHEEIKPLILYYTPPFWAGLHLKVRRDNLLETIAFIGKISKQFKPDDAFTYSFVDERFASQYREEIRAGQMIGSFATLAIIVPSADKLGLLILPMEAVF